MCQVGNLVALSHGPRKVGLPLSSAEMWKVRLREARARRKEVGRLPSLWDPVWLAVCLGLSFTDHLTVVASSQFISTMILGGSVVLWR